MDFATTLHCHNRLGFMYLATFLALISQVPEPSTQRHYTIADQNVINGEIYSSLSYRISFQGIGVFEGPIHESGLIVYGNKNGTSSFAFVNLLSAGPEKVFEFRKGNLVAGEMKDRRFIPDVGSVVRSLDDYVLEGLRTRIYNLPGTLVRKSQPRSRSSAKKELEPIPLRQLIRAMSLSLSRTYRRVTSLRLGL
jgi:hypothetical protein